MANLDQYLGSYPSAQYVSRNRYSSTVVQGDIDWNKKEEDQKPTAKSIAYTYADDVVLLLGLMLLGGYMKSGKPFSKIVGKFPGWASNITGLVTGSDFVGGHSYYPRPGSPGFDGAFKITKKRIGHEVYRGSRLIDSLGSNKVAAMAMSADILRLDWGKKSEGFIDVSRLKIHEFLFNRTLSKHVPGIENIVKHNTGFSAYRFDKPFTFSQAKENIRHETWHRAIAKRARELSIHDGSFVDTSHSLWNRFGSSITNEIKKTDLSEFIIKAYGGLSLDEFVAYTFSEKNAEARVGAMHFVSQERYSRVKKSIADNLREDQEISKWINPETNTFNYYGMKKYLGESTGAANVISKKFIGRSEGLSRILPYFSKNIIPRIALAASLLFAGQASAHGQTTPSSLRGEIESVESLYDLNATTRTNASNLLYETAVHESGLLKYTSQRGGGPAKGLFQMEPDTAKYLIGWAKSRPRARNLIIKESGFTYKQLSKMSSKKLGNYLVSNEKFAAAMARLKYASSPGSIPSTVEGRAHYWSKYYQGTNNPSKELGYISDNKKMAEEIRASSVSRVLGKHIRSMPRNYGMVQKLHDNKIGHAIASVAKKLAMRGL